jgi:hypothetical protein
MAQAGRELAPPLSHALPAAGAVAGGSRASRAAGTAPPRAGSPSAAVDRALVCPPSLIESPAALGFHVCALCGRVESRARRTGRNGAYGSLDG